MYSNILINNLAFDEAALEQDLIPVNQDPNPPSQQMIQIMANAMNQGGNQAQFSNSLK